MWVLFNEDNQPLYRSDCLLHFLQAVLYSRRNQMIIVERRMADPIEIDGMEWYMFLHGSLESEYAGLMWETICTEGEVERILFSRGEYAISYDEEAPSLR